MRKAKDKTTQLFKNKFIEETILPYIKFIGIRLYFAYTWNGERRFATIYLKDLISIIKWDVKI